MCKEASVQQEVAEEAVVAAVEAAAEASVAEETAPVETMEDHAAELEESIKKGPQDEDPVWDKFAEMLKEKTIFPVKVDSVVKAGVVAYVDDVRGFIPASKLSTGYVENLEEFKGKTLDVVVITAEKEGRKLVLSAREAIRQKEREAKAAALAACQVGDVLEGTVDSLMDYGAFLDLENGLSGLLHVSQIAFKRVEKPSDVLKKGEKVKVKIIAIKDGKLSLSIKALKDNGSKPERAPRERRDREERDTFNYRETGKATTSLGDLLKGVKLD